MKGDPIIGAERSLRPTAGWGASGGGWEPRAGTGARCKAVRLACVVGVVLGLDDSGRVGPQEISELTYLASPLSVQRKLTPALGKARTRRRVDTWSFLSPSLPVPTKGSGRKGRETK